MAVASNITDNIVAASRRIAESRGDFASIITDSPSGGALTTMPSITRISSWLELGIRGDTWKECGEWFNAMPGSLFQLTCVFFCLAFMGGGHNAIAATYTHVLCACSFLSFAIFAGIDACSPDIMVWGLIMVFVNVGQIIFISYKSKLMEDVFDSDMQAIYHKRFAPFEISPQMFVELVTCKGCELLKLEKGQKYAAEGKTPIEKLSMLLTGKISVSSEGNFLHYISGNDFIDSPEWESLKSSSSKDVYKVSITAESDCRYITWKRKPLLVLLCKRRRLGKLIHYMIGRDVVKKLYCLNARQFNARGFHYDIRLPCIMSLRDDVMNREKKRQESASQPGTPAGRRHKKLGKKANEHYARLFARRMSERMSMLKDRRLPLIRKIEK